MVGDFIQARDVLHERLAAVFGSPAFQELYPDAMVPTVTFGFPVNEPPAFVAVDEIASDIAADGRVTMAHDEYGFALGVYAFAQNVDLKAAADSLMCYVDAVFGAILADHTLQGTVDNAIPRVVSEGTSADSSKRYIAAAQIQIECRRFSVCPAEIKEIVDAIEG